MLAVVLTLARVTLEYDAKLEFVHETMEQIFRAQSKAIAASLWQLDATELSVLAEGMLHSDITYVAIYCVDGPPVEAGIRHDRDVIMRQEDLVYERQVRRRRSGRFCSRSRLMISDLERPGCPGLHRQVIVVALVALGRHPSAPGNPAHSRCGQLLSHL